MNITIIFMTGLIAAIAVFDVWVIANKGKQESISAHLIRLSHKHPSIPFLIGFVAGHIWWRMAEVDVYPAIEGITK